MGERYYREVYQQSEEYVNELLKQEQVKEEYYAKHPEKLEEVNNKSKQTQEDRLLEKSGYTILGFNDEDVSEILEELHGDCEKLISFLARDDIQEFLKFNWKIKGIFKNKLGKACLNKAKKLRKNKKSIFSLKSGFISGKKISVNDYMSKKNSIIA